MSILSNIIRDIKQVEVETQSDSTENILWSLSTNNALPGMENGDNSWLLPTHTAWGKDDKEEINADLKDAQERILKTISNIISSGETIVDVSSLSKVADGRFKNAILEGIRKGYEAGHRPLIRLLWGKTPLLSVVQGDYGAIDEFVDNIKRVAPGLPVVAALTNFEEIGHEKSWNHSKIVAADGRLAMVGGMNLWSSDYMSAGSTVTDLSVEIQGDAAKGAQQFLNEIWSYVQEKGSSSLYPKLSPSLNPTYAVSANISGKHYVKAIPESAATISGSNSVPVLSVGRAAWLRNGRTTNATDKTITKELKDFATGWLWDAVSEGGVMNEGNPQWDANNPGDTALRSLVRNAQKEVTISQQMLDFKVVEIGKPLFDLRLYEAMANRIAEGVDISIITSNLNTAGDYKASNPGKSWRAIAALVYRELQTSSSMLMASVDELENKALELMKDNLSIKGLRVSEKDAWPDQSKNPGLHSKVISVDNNAFYVGSQNAYPNQLTEFGYIIEDHTATKALEDLYLDKMNRYSKEFAITHKAGFRSLLPKNSFLQGGTDPGFFNAGDGDDRVIGSSNNDQIRGGLGADRMTGKEGIDSYIYLSALESEAADGKRDQITDFNPLEDLIDLTSLWNREAGATGHYLASEAFSGERFEIRLQQKNDGTLLQVDTNGDKLSDLEIMLSGLNTRQFTETALT